MASASQAQEAGTRWRLRITDPGHQVRVDAIIRFGASRETASCAGGHWRRLHVERSRARDEKFFPLSEPLAYQHERDQLVLGRTRRCDNYLLMSGKQAASRISGPYYRGGLGGAAQLGSFTLKKIR